VKGFIFKGFPRTLVQSYILDGLLKKHGTSISRVIELEVPTLELIKRLDERRNTERCMPYDTTTARIVQRLNDHENLTVPVIRKYQQLHGVVKVDGMGSFDEVFKREGSVSLRDCQCQTCMSELPKSVVLTLAYDGTAFRGWQRLPGAGRTVQEAVENALVAISGQGLPVSGASRTDGGVHASGQCAMFRSAKVPEPERLLRTLNKALPRDVACLGVRMAVHNFDPRYRATAKTYIYRLHDGASPDKTAGRYSFHVDAKLDDTAMIEALALLAGEHDFSAFTNAKPALARGLGRIMARPGKSLGNDFSRHLFETRLERKGSLIGLVFKGDGFLYNQVRIMASAVVEWGRQDGSCGCSPFAEDRGPRFGPRGPLCPWPEAGQCGLP
jgi:tRNA pseudouridine(38-40) synthase